MQRSHLLSVSQLRSRRYIELLHKRALVAAKAWASHYPKKEFKRDEIQDELSIQDASKRTA